MISRLAAVTIIAVLFLGAERTAIAGTSSDAGAADAVGDAFRSFNDGDYASAREKFAAEVSGARPADAWFGLGRSEQMLHHDPAALIAFRHWLKTEKGSAPPPRETEWSRQNVVDVVATLTLKVGHLVIDAPSTAVVTVDGVQVALDDDDVPVAPGSHLVEARRGGETTSATAEVAAGNSARVRLSFSDKASTPPVPPSPSESALTSRLRNGAYALGFALVSSALLVFGSLQRRRRRPRRGRSSAKRDPE